MRSAPSQSDTFLSAHGPDQPSPEILAEQEEDLISESDAAKMFRDAPEDVKAYINAIIDQEEAGYGLDPSPPSVVSETAESPSPRRRQQPSTSPPKPSPPKPPTPPPPPSPSYPGAWDRGRACVVNATNTYWSFGREPGCSQSSNGGLANGERVYMKRPDGSYRWAVFKQQARSTLAAQSRLDQMVIAVGGDPASFRTRLAKADYVLAWEEPTGVVHEEDDEEMFSVSFPIYLGQPASGFFWGVGQLGNGTLTMAASTQDEMERF